MHDPRPRLFLIDGYSNIFRAYYAIRNLSNSRGEPTNAVYGFIQMLKKLLREERPELIGVALDLGGSTLRTEKFEAYKANRTPTPEDLKSQIPLVRRALEAYRIPVLELSGYEADDVLGTLALRAAGEGFDVVLVSADKDLMQLIGPNVSMYHTGRNKLYGPAEVTEDFGLPPEKVVDVLALMGDAVDNVPGVPGIGDKGAKALIQEYGSLEALLDRAGEITRKSYRESLTANRELALLSKELVTIQTDLPIALDPLALRLDEPNEDALRSLFADLEFFSLLEELKASARQSPSEIVAAEEIIDRAAFEQAAGQVGGELCVTLLGAEPPIGLAWLGGDGLPRYIDLRRADLADAACEAIRAWLGNSELKLIGHDLKELMRRICDAPIAADLFDEMIVSYLLKPSIHGHALDELAVERLNRTLLTAKEVGWDKGQEPPQGDSRLGIYAGERLAVVRALEGSMREELAAAGSLGKVYAEIERPLLSVLVRMEETGILLDVEFLHAMARELNGEIHRLEEEIFVLAGEKFNLGSPQQLGVLLFEKLGYPVLKRTQKTKSYSTGAEILEELAARGYPIAERILRYRELTKLQSTYVEALPGMVAADGRLHTRFNQAVAATGRLSSTNPNLQNIPIRTEIGQRIRRAFIAAPGHCLVIADYSQVELRILAHIAEDPTLVAAFEAGEDIHRATAATVLNVDPDLVTPEQRRAAKVINFGILYGMSAFGLAANLKIPQKEADRFIREYLERFPGVRRYIEETESAAERDGKVETLYGRVRWLPDMQSKNRNLRENAKRMAINARIQGTAADLLKLAMIAVDARLAAEHPAVRLLLTVHDELVFEVPAADADRVAQVVKEEMEGVAKLRVPLVVDTGRGASWYEAKA
ncbi:MAG TPA: DNA polymerase I [Thermoanaerobaculia bacterium]|jgi:DNA polymerase-1|nr:DNA polymerase I [Thermoanaerobaculia bacterium]